jgi:septum formation protein
MQSRIEAPSSQQNIMKKLILASASPRRKQILEDLGLKFTVEPSDFEEIDDHTTPQELAEHNAEGKALQIAQKHPKTPQNSPQGPPETAKSPLIIAVDTVVACPDKHDTNLTHLLGKPKSPKHHREMLELLSDSTHKVISAISIIDTGTNKQLTKHETTLVSIEKIAPQQINAYLASGEGDDKASGYAIQGLGALFIKKIEGDYFNVVGLPVYLLNKMLQEFGVEIL